MTWFNIKRPSGIRAIESFIDPSAIIHAEGSIAWWYSRLLQHVVVGKNVSIGGGTELGRGTVVGDGSRIGANCFFPPNSTIGKNVFVGPAVNCADDMHPRIRKAHESPYEARPPVIEDDAVIGIGASLGPGVTIGRGAFVAMGSVVDRNVRAGAFVKGNPAREFIPSPETADEYGRLADFYPELVMASAIAPADPLHV